MTVEARFYCRLVETFPHSPTASRVQFGAVCRGTANKQWASATPAGSIDMTIRNDDATAQFVEGCEYQVIFRKVEKPAPGDGHQPAPEWPAYMVGREPADREPNECGVCGVVSVEVDGKARWDAHHAMYDEGGTVERMHEVFDALKAEAATAREA